MFFQGNDDVVDECMASLDSIESAYSVYLVYIQDVERRGEFVIDSALYPTGPVKDKSWKSILNDKTKINLPKSSVSNSGVEFPKTVAYIMIYPTPASDAREYEPTDVALQSIDVMSQEGKDGQVTSVHDSNEMAADVAETNLFKTSIKCQDSILIGPDSNNGRIYAYLTRQVV